MKIVVYGIILLLLCAIIYYIAIPLYIGNKKTNSKDPTLWESDIEKFRIEDKTLKLSESPIVLAGSSSIRLWDGMPESIGGFPVLNRGFGGAKIADLDYYINDLLIKHEPKLVVIYVGAIDFSINPESAEQSIIQEYAALCEKIKTMLPNTLLGLIALRPSPYRDTKYAAFNQSLKDLAQNNDGVYYINANDAVADENGLPRKDLYLWDRQHLNKEGYNLWGTRLLSILEEIIKENSGRSEDSAR